MDYEKRLAATLVYINSQIEAIDWHVSQTHARRELLSIRQAHMTAQTCIRGRVLASRWTVPVLAFGAPQQHKRIARIAGKLSSIVLECL
jgi:hypothetical protein